jgi:hypothetical protein
LLLRQGLAGQWPDKVSVAAIAVGETQEYLSRVPVGVDNVQSFASGLSKIEKAERAENYHNACKEWKILDRKLKLRISHWTDGPTGRHLILQCAPGSFKSIKKSLKICINVMSTIGPQLLVK